MSSLKKVPASRRAKLSYDDALHRVAVEAEKGAREKRPLPFGQPRPPVSVAHL